MITKKTKRANLLEVFISYRPILKKMLQRMVPSADIEDIVQETFIRAHEAEVKKRIDHPKAYIYKTARNLALNFIAKKENTSTFKLEDFSEPDVYLEDYSNINEVESKEKFRLFCAAVRELPPQCRKAFIMKRVFGYSIKDISMKLGITESTTEKHIAKGVLRCADYLNENGYHVSTRSKHPLQKDNQL